MKIVPVDKSNHRFAITLGSDESAEPALVTNNSEARGLFLRLPEELKNPDIEVRILPHAPDGAFLFVVQVRGIASADQLEKPQPRFGACKGMPRILAEDDEHLNDFAEYMR